MKEDRNTIRMSRKSRSYKLGTILFGLFILVSLIVSLRGNAWSMKGQAVQNSTLLTIPSYHEDTSISSQTSPITIDISRQLTGTITTTLSLPIVQNNFVNQRPLGQVEMLSGPTACDGQDCYQLRVSCPYLKQTDDLTLKVGEPISSTLGGTIVFATGWTGTYYWDAAALNMAEFEGVKGVEEYIPSLAVLGNNADIIQTLRVAGYRTVQIKWANNWFKSQLGVAEGIANLACRPATVAQWVYDNFPSTSNMPYCAVGHSNGASQFGYSITQYGEYNLFSAVIYESGPNWSRIDTACLHDDPANQALFAASGERNTIDWGFGFNNNGTGACAQMNIDYQPDFQHSSLALGAWPYNYPNLKVGFVFGGSDQTTTLAQGMYYHDLLVNSASPNITMTVVSGAPHFVTSTAEGAQAVQSTIMNLCQ